MVESDDYYTGRYISVSDAGATMALEPLSPRVTSKVAIEKHLAEGRHRTRVLKALLGIAHALNRDLILPRMLCYCDFMWKEMKACRVGGAETMRLPFECPMDHVLDTPKWFEDRARLTPFLNVSVREANFLLSPRILASTQSSIARVQLQTGLTDQQVVAAMQKYTSTAVIEIEDVVGTFCGFVDAAATRAFERDSQKLLAYHRSPFCYEDGIRAASYSQCCKPRKPGDDYFPCIYGFDDPEPLPSCVSAISSVTSGGAGGS